MLIYYQHILALVMLLIVELVWLHHMLLEQTALYKSENPDASPADVIANLTRSGSLPTTLCDGGAHGYFNGDLDKINEPLLFREINSNN